MLRVAGIFESSGFSCAWLKHAAASEPVGAPNGGCRVGVAAPQANHHRKLRRLAKKAGLKKPKKEKPVELTIPKSWVHKEAMLKAILEERQHAEGVPLGAHEIRAQWGPRKHHGGWGS